VPPEHHAAASPRHTPATIEPCRESDVPQVANLHCRLFYGTASCASQGLQAYYHEVFFRNPWLCADLPSLVCRAGNGDVIGFMGRIPRRMIFRNQPIRIAIAHRLMVAPDGGDPLVALRLVKTFLGGPQDLAISDGANDRGRRFWEAAGGRTSPFYSMAWHCPLQPSRYLLSILASRRARRLAGAILWPVWPALDRYLSRKWRIAQSVLPEPGLEQEMDPPTLLRCIAETSADAAIRPQYDACSLEWLWARLRENTDRGCLTGKAVFDRAGRIAGGFLSYVRDDGVGEVVFTAARPEAVGIVLASLLRDGMRRRLIALRGRIEPCFLLSLMAHGCILKRNSWGLLHSRVPEINQTIDRQDAFLSGLEGELWLRSPKDEL
jgi:hypothetical protein